MPDPNPSILHCLAKVRTADICPPKQQMSRKFWVPFVNRSGPEPKDFIWGGGFTSCAANAG